MLAGVRRRLTVVLICISMMAHLGLSFVPFPNQWDSSASGCQGEPWNQGGVEGGRQETLKGGYSCQRKFGVLLGAGGEYGFCAVSGQCLRCRPSWFYSCCCDQLYPTCLEFFRLETKSYILGTPRSLVALLASDPLLCPPAAVGWPASAVPEAHGSAVGSPS